MDSKGKIIISRDYRGECTQVITDKFQRKVLEQEERLLKPVFTDKDITYIWIKVNNIYMVSVAKGNPNVAMVLTFLYKIRDCFVSYFKALEDESLRDNFVITYELLDEMMDHGYPQITEEKVLHEYIKTEANKMVSQKNFMGNLKKFTGADAGGASIQNLNVPTAASNAVSWRPEGIKYAKNEVFLDVVERLNLLVSSNGTVLRSEILGAVKMKCNLTGMPELKLGLNDKTLFEMTGKQSRNKLIDLEDVKFHQCVRLNKFDTERLITFVPPDGDFELMSYRVDT